MFCFIVDLKRRLSGWAPSHYKNISSRAFSTTSGRRRNQGNSKHEKDLMSHCWLEDRVWGTCQGIHSISRKKEWPLVDSHKETGPKSYYPQGAWILPTTILYLEADLCPPPHHSLQMRTQNCRHLDFSHVITMNKNSAMTCGTSDLQIIWANKWVLFKATNRNLLHSIRKQNHCHGINPLLESLWGGPPASRAYLNFHSIVYS